MRGASKSNFRILIALTLNVKKGKFFGFRSMSVNSVNNFLVAGPIMQIAVYADVTSDTATEPSDGKCR